jgi:membrane associated rhomboid family serine protease
VIVRRADHVLLASGPLRLLVVEPASLAGLEQAVASAMERAPRLNGVVFVNTAGLDAKPLLADRKLPGVVWAPGAVPEPVGGMMTWRTLDAAIVKLESGQVPAVEPIFHEREQASSEIDRFLGPLQRRRPIVTWGIAGVSVALFGLQYLWGNGEPVGAAARMGAGIPSLILRGELWRLLTSTVLHGSVLHLAMNLIALFGFGTFLERLLGWRRYLLLYVASGLAGSLATLVRPSDVLSVGASGGIWGLMVAGAALVTWPRGKLPDLLAMSMRRRAWSPIVINALYSFRPGIDLLAHFGGGVVGGLLIFSGVMTLGLDPLGRKREPSALTGAAVACALALFASIGAAFAAGRPWELRAKPTLETVQLDGASIALPRLMGGEVRKQVSGARTYALGQLRYDPLSFTVVLADAPLSAAEAADPEAALRASIKDLDEPQLEGFTTLGQPKVGTRDGRPYLQFQRSSADGRFMNVWWLVEGDRISQVVVYTSNDTSAPWRAVADELPFTLKLDQPARSPKTQE